MWHIHTMASSEEEEGDSLKFYLYAKDTRNQNFFCLELHVHKPAHSLTLSIKAKDEASAASLKKYVIDLLTVNELISE